MKFLKNKTYMMPILIVVGVLLFVLVVYTAYTYWRESSVDVINPHVSNASNGTITISWQSSEPSVGLVSYGESSFFLPIYPFIGKYVEFEDRDVEIKDNKLERLKDGGLKTYYTHHVTIEDLSADTQYFYRIGNGFTIARSDFQSGAYKSFTTLPVLDELKAPDPIYGRVVDEDGEPIGDAIVYMTMVTTNGLFSEIQSAVTNDEGGWSMDVANTRYLRIKTYAEEEKPISDTIWTENLEVISTPAYRDKTLKADPNIDQPVPDIILLDK